MLGTACWPWTADNFFYYGSNILMIIYKPFNPTQELAMPSTVLLSNINDYYDDRSSEKKNNVTLRYQNVVLTCPLPPGICRFHNYHLPTRDLPFELVLAKQHQKQSK